MDAGSEGDDEFFLPVLSERIPLRIEEQARQLFKPLLGRRWRNAAAVLGCGVMALIVVCAGRVILLTMARLDADVGLRLTCCTYTQDPQACEAIQYDSTCCQGSSSGVSVACGAGSMCCENAAGYSYCCAPGTSCCLGACLDPMSRQGHLNGGGTCNGAGAEGFKAGTKWGGANVLFVGAPWDGTLGRYDFREGVNPQLGTGFFDFGKSDFTLRFKLTPKATGRLTDAQKRTGVLFSLVDGEPHSNRGLLITFNYAVLFVFIEASDTLQRQPLVQVPLPNLVAGVPLELAIVRRGTAIETWQNGNMTSRNFQNPVVDLRIKSDVTLGGILGQGSAGREELNLDTYVSDMSSSFFADM